MPSTITTLTNQTFTFAAIKALIVATFTTNFGWTALDDYTDATFQYLVFSKQFENTTYGTCFLRIRFSLTANFAFTQEIGTAYNNTSKVLADSNGPLAVSSNISAAFTAKTIKHNAGEFEVIALGGVLLGIFRITNKNNWTSNEYAPFLIKGSNNIFQGCVAQRMSSNNAAVTMLVTGISGSNQFNGVDYLTTTIYLSSNSILGSSSTDVVGASSAGLVLPGGKLNSDYHYISSLHNSVSHGLFLR